MLQQRLSDSIQGLPVDVSLGFQSRDFGCEMRSPPTTPRGGKGRRHFAQLSAGSDLLG